MKNIFCKVNQFTFLLAILMLIITSCNIKKESVSEPYYDVDSHKMLFCIGNNLEKWNLKMDIYWEDSLLCSPYIDYKGSDSCFIDIFPNSIIGGYNAKPYILEMCYSYSKNGFLPLRYVLVNKKNNNVLFDTVLHVSKIIKEEIRERFNKVRTIPFPIVDLKGTGFNYLHYTDYYAFAKGTLYTKGMQETDKQVLMQTANYVDALLNHGYQMYFISQTNFFPGKISNKLSIHVPKSIPKVYLLLASLSGRKNAKDFSFKTEQEIAEFLEKEYVLDFKNAVINRSKYIEVPITAIGNHKYNFVQILFVVHILPDNNYQYIPIAYILTHNPQEVLDYMEEDNLVKYIVSPIGRYYIDGLYMINYYGPTTLF